MKANNIYFDLGTNLAFEPDEQEDTARPQISVTTKAQALAKCREIRRERIFMTSAAAAVIAADLLILGIILKIGSMIAISTSSFAQAGCYITGMCFFMLSFLESLAVIKRSGVVEALAHIWKVITGASVAGLVIMSAVSCPDAGGSIITTAFAGFTAHLLMRKK